MAYADDIIVIDGVNCAPVEITNEQIKAMFDNGDITAFYRLWASTSANISLFDMANQTSTTVTIGDSDNYTTYQLTGCDLFNQSYDRLFFYNDYAYNLRVNSTSTLYTQFVLDMPFNYYIQDYSIYACTYYTGLSNDQNTTAGVTFRTDPNVNSYTTNLSGERKVAYWSQHQALKQWYAKYNWLPNNYTFTTTSGSGIRCTYSTYQFDNLTDDRLFSSFVFNSIVNNAHASGTGWEYFFPAPMVGIFSFAGTVYVPVTYEEQVLEYLDLITSEPTAANQQRIDELTNEFQQKEQELSDLAEDLTVTVPDTSGAIAGLPEEAQDGADEFAEFIFNPTYSIPLVTILVSCALGFAVLKLILYGSGSS